MQWTVLCFNFLPYSHFLVWLREFAYSGHLDDQTDFRNNPVSEKSLQPIQIEKFLVEKDCSVKEGRYRIFDKGEEELLVLERRFQEKEDLRETKFSWRKEQGRPSNRFSGELCGFCRLLSMRRSSHNGSLKVQSNTQFVRDFRAAWEQKCLWGDVRFWNNGESLWFPTDPHAKNLEHGQHQGRDQNFGDRIGIKNKALVLISELDMSICLHCLFWTVYILQAYKKICREKGWAWMRREGYRNSSFDIKRACEKASMCYRK